MLAALAVLLSATLSAEPAAASAPDPLAPLRFLVGHCWAGDFPGGAGTDTHCFESVYGGKFVRDRHVVRGKGPDYRGESIYAFDPKQQRIVFWYWSSGGAIESGTVEAAADGLNFPEHRLTQPKDLAMRTHWQRIGDDRYEAVNESRSGDEAWKTAWRIVYVRTRKTP